MAIIRPFKGVRPPKKIVKNLSSLPYDVMSSEEAAEMAKDKPESLLHITRAEIDLPDCQDIHSEKVYEKAVENYKKFKYNKWLIQDDKPHYYIYAQTMDGRTQYGVVGAAAAQDYFDGVIKKHELTRPDKEEDRMVLTRYLNANIEPVFFSYKAVPEIDEIVERIVQNNEPVYDFTAEDGFGHHFWVVESEEDNKQLQQLFKEKVPYTYVADGHHRTAAAARIMQEKKAKNPNHTGEEEYNFFLAVHFPDNQLKIIDYNRVVKDLNGLSEEEFLEKLKQNFDVEKMGKKAYKPNELHEFSMYLDKNWYRLKAKPGTYDDNDPIKQLDVTVLSEHILEPILDIQDLRTSKRIDFVGGIRGLEELKKRVDSGKFQVAFALYPVSMKQLINIADTGNIMPPKTTWFEPKLRSGLVIHELN